MADLPEFIYRSGGRLRTLSLHRELDWQTGLSFRDFPYGQEYVQLEVEQLIKNGFIVRPDAGEKVTLIFTNAPYIEPNSGEELHFDEGHVTVWHLDRKYWNAWHDADKRNLHTDKISPQLAYFARAIVKIVKV